MNTADWPKAEAARPRYTPSWPLGRPPGSPSLCAEVDGSGLRRLWRTLMVARLGVALALLSLEGWGWWHGLTPGWIVVLGVAFVAATAASLGLPPAPPHASAWSPRWLLTLWVDLAVFATLEALAPSGLNFTPLFVWPVLLAAVLGPRRLALGTASAATLVLLGRAWQLEAAVGNAAWLQAAVTGAGLLGVALLASHLTARLAGETAAAQRSRAQAQLQSEVNRLIANGLQEGIIVAGDDGCPWYVNPAAARMLGVPPGEADEQRTTRAIHNTAWRSLAQWLHTPQPPGDRGPQQRDLTLPQPDGSAVRVRAQWQTVTAADGACAHVVLLQDLQALQRRIHTEKLAAMGRVSAAVAHEIRNPLAAIAQASALLQEDDPSPTQRRLLTLIEQNVQRLARTVDDVLEAARYTPQDASMLTATILALDTVVDSILDEWLMQHPQGTRLQRHQEAAGAHIVFDSEHLRRVLINLLDNADRHASGAAGAIRVETRVHPPHAMLTIWSDSPPIQPPLRDHLFEPFTSSHSRSSGLGLYLSRELCRRYKADLTYQIVERHNRLGNAFIVVSPLVHPTSPSHHKSE